jgi:2-oxoisovalerate ferredoxin oxidoreductase alpha subunit
MQEGMSYLAGAQLPALVVNIMRTGPGLGNIGPEQGDYNQAVKGGGHGNYHSIVLAPASVQEMCDLTIRAFEMAFKYRNPAMILADATLGQVMESLKLPDHESHGPETSDWSVQGDLATKRNLISSIFLEPDKMEMHNRHLQEKYASMQHEAIAESYLTDDAEVILTGYGTSARVARSAVDQLRAEGVKAGLFRPISLMPFPIEQLNKAAAGKKVLVVEMSNGQYMNDVILYLDRKKQTQVRLCNRMGGVLIQVDDVMRAANDLMKEEF